MFTEFWKGGRGGAPPWASIRTPTYQYTEYYAPDLTTVQFREFYPASDRYQLRNLLWDGVPGNNPNVAALHAALAGLRSCGRSACP
jgi:hypothetical protein